MTTPVLQPPKPSEPFVGVEHLLLHMRSPLHLTDHEFAALCQQNPELRIEQTAEGDIVIMPPTGFGTGQSGHLTIYAMHTLFEITECDIKRRAAHQLWQGKRYLRLQIVTSKVIR